jgi:type I restriction-modification system DNA methylase subunit
LFYQFNQKEKQQKVMKKLSQLSDLNIKSIISSQRDNGGSIKLYTILVDFIGIENEDYELIQAEYVCETSQTYEITNRLGDRFSGNGSIDGMRDAWDTSIQTEIKKEEDPEMSSFTYKVKGNGKIVKQPSLYFKRDFPQF